jgi:transposase InsO family protein
MLEAIIETTSMDEQELGEYLRSNGLHSSDLEAFKNEFIKAKKETKRGRPQLDAEVFKFRFKKKDTALSEYAARVILLKKKSRDMEQQRGRRVIVDIRIEALDLISEAYSSRCRIKIACGDVGIDFKSHNRWKEDLVDKRNGPLTEPANKLSDDIKKEIIEIETSKEYVDLSPWEVVPKLADKGTYLASESSFYKILKENKLLVHRGRAKAPAKKRPVPLVATGPNQIWSWDITYLKSNIRGEYFYLYLFMDVFSRKIVGYDIFNNESMDYSAQLFETICINEGILKDQLVLHSDNGGPMKGATMLATLQRLGFMPSFSRPRVSDDNPYSESLFKTLKYKSDYPEIFTDLSDVKKWILKFVDWYNEEHFHSGIKFVTPASRHRGEDKNILDNRKMVYTKAKLKNPERWNSRKRRNWDREEKVYLNHLQKNKNIDISMAS